MEYDLNIEKALKRAKEIPIERTKALLLSMGIKKELGQKKGIERTGEWKLVWQNLEPICFMKENEKLEDFLIPVMK
jgi:hypothetical protein